LRFRRSFYSFILFNFYSFETLPMAIPTTPTPRILFHGRFLDLAAIGSWEFVQRTRGSPVGLIAVTPGDAIVLISQFRIPIQKTIIEIPAGLIGDSVPKAGEAAPVETWEIAAARELREETGWTAGHFEKLSEGPTSAGLTSECVTFVRATGLVKAGEQEPDGDEQITVHEVPLAGVDAWLRAREEEGALIDPKIWAALYFISRSAGR
jgi:ADP-ribose pyrophosphatase